MDSYHIWYADVKWHPKV